MEATRGVSGWHEDPNNPGWYLWEGSDAGQEKNWTQTVASEPPGGFYADPRNPGWYFNGRDPADLASWWSDETVPPPDLTATPNPWEFWSPETIARVAQVPVAAVRGHWPALHAELVAAGQGSKNSLAGAIATVAIETASTFQPVREAFWLSDAWRHANLRYAPWWGRGYIQLTWESNYRAASDALGIDLMTNPDKAMEPDVAAKVFAWYWASRNLQAPANGGNWREVRRLVQGGDAGLDRLTQIVLGLLG